MPIPNLAASRHWYLQAALAGERVAACEMGCFCFEDGNLPEAILWLEYATTGERDKNGTSIFFHRSGVSCNLRITFTPRGRAG
ncbi:hypothetical protein IV102_29710 [bacterium]|nr:hypothetical protein [bacterium]